MILFCIFILFLKVIYNLGRYIVLRFFRLPVGQAEEKKSLSFTVSGLFRIFYFLPSLLKLFSFTVRVLLYDIRIDFAGLDYKKECRSLIDGCPR